MFCKLDTGYRLSKKTVFFRQDVLFSKKIFVEEVVMDVTNSLMTLTPGRRSIARSLMFVGTVVLEGLKLTQTERTVLFSINV